MKDALTIHRALLERETPHQIVRLPVAITHADELPRALGLPARRCLVTRVYACNDVHRERRFLTGVVVAAGTLPPTEVVRHAVGARLIRPARPDLVNAVTEYAAGLVCPLLLPEAMPLLIDQSVVDANPLDEVVYTATGEPSTALAIRSLDLYTVSGAKPVALPSAQTGAASTSAYPSASPPASAPAKRPAPASHPAPTAAEHRSRRPEPHRT
ncbi:aminoacyl-tRNA deacylase [Actinomadura miaoliensis]|uniref:YbaK/aminoacyl-tRNA synthetase-associated domain-containing protein n=1 Tax=Actinomadura miaoliensis TaxID=430685 RepID=A0ABP7V8Z3_9ACTN